MKTTRLGDCPIGAWVLLPRKRIPERVIAQSPVKTYLSRYKLRVNHIDTYHCDEPSETAVRVTDRPEWADKIRL